MKWAIILFTCDVAKIGPRGPKPCPNFWFFSSQLVRKNDITYCGSKYIFLKSADLPTNENEKKKKVIKQYKLFWKYRVIFSKYFKDLMTDILIFCLIFPSNFKTIAFCKSCVFVKYKKLKNL